MMRLSQGQLNLLETCPRRFQHIYLDQLGAPTTPEQQERQNWGTQFHLLMQQRELGLPIDAFENPLQRCVQALVAAAPEISQRGGGFRQSEHRRTLEFQGYLLTVIYDLLILEDDALILDWKTYPRPQNSRWLTQNWQTRLYRFVLAATSDYLPEQIVVTYWFVQPQQDGVPPQPQSLRLPYSSDQYERDRQDLSRLLGQLTGWLQHYQTKIFSPVEFPQVETAAACPYCHFAMRCQRDQADLDVEPITLSLAEIQEVSL